MLASDRSLSSNIHNGGKIHLPVHPASKREITKPLKIAATTKFFSVKLFFRY